GVYGVIHGALRLGHERQPRDYTIGPDPTTLFHAPAELLPVASFPLIHSTGSDYEIVFTREMTGELTVDGRTIPLDHTHAFSTVPGASAIAIPDGARARLELGLNTFLVSSVEPPPRWSMPLSIDWEKLAYVGAVGAAWAIFLAMIFAM